MPLSAHWLKDLIPVVQKCHSLFLLMNCLHVVLEGICYERLHGRTISQVRRILLGENLTLQKQVKLNFAFKVMLVNQGETAFFLRASKTHCNFCFLKWFVYGVFLLVRNSSRRKQLDTVCYSILKEPCSPGRGLLLFSSTPRNETGDMPRENCQTVPVML